MKRVFALVICFAVLLSAIPAQASEEVCATFVTETVLDNGFIVISELYLSQNARATEKTATNKRTIKDGDTVIAIIAMTATFRYDGTNVAVVSKSVTQSDTYDGWSYVQNSFTSAGGTVTLSAKLTKWIILNTSFTMTLSCDKDGNISYT